jgi:hypothetical protein
MNMLLKSYMPHDSSKKLNQTRNLYDLSSNFQNNIRLCHIAAVRKELKFFKQFYLLVILRKYINGKTEQNKCKNEKVYVQGTAM